MTILSVCQDVAKVIGMKVPSVVVTSTTRQHLELAALAQEMAERIAKEHYWTDLKTLATYTGDGSTTQFSLPSDYSRMLKKTQFWVSDKETPLTHITDADEWLEMDVRSNDFLIGAWTKISGNIEIKPAMATAVTAKWYYISDLIISPSAGDNKINFTADDDSFQLSEQLLKLGMIWQWKANKGIPYAEDMTNYNILLEKEISEDKGSRMFRVGRVRMPKGTNISYPQPIVVS